MPDDIYELDETDFWLKEMLGDRFHDETENKANVVDLFTVYSDDNENEPAKPVRKHSPKFAKNGEPQWEPVKERNGMDKLRDCVKTTAFFGGLNLLIFYWQQAGLMESSIAVPCMCAVCGLMGLGIGEVVGDKK